MDKIDHTTKSYHRVLDQIEQELVEINNALTVTEEQTWHSFALTGTNTDDKVSISIETDKSGQKKPKLYFDDLRDFIAVIKEKWKDPKEGEIPFHDKYTDLQILSNIRMESGGLPEAIKGISEQRNFLIKRIGQTVKKIKTGRGFDLPATADPVQAYEKTFEISQQTDGQLLEVIRTQWCKCPLTGDNMYEIEFAGQKLDASGSAVYLDPMELEQIVQNKNNFKNWIMGSKIKGGIIFGLYHSTNLDSKTTHK